MKHLTQIVLIGLCSIGSASVGFAQIIVNDTWLDGERHTPAAPVYSEFGIDGDLDGDIESAWFAGGSGTFDPVGPGGPLRLQQTTSSSSLTTYFTAEGSELMLANAGDWLRVTWQFDVSGQVDPNTSQGLRIALVDSPASSRVSDENSPGADQYSGYSLFLNMDTTLTHGDPFELHERANPDLFENLLSSSSAWTPLAADGTQGNTGYLPGNTYTFMMTLTRTALGEIDILTSMAGGSIDNDGLMSIAYTDATPNGGSFSFDTFQFRPDGYDRSYEIIDTSLFMVEYMQVPEPSAFALLGLGSLALMLRRRK